MDDACEYLWRLHSENMTHVRHVETQRSTIASVLIPVASALLAAIAFQWGQGAMIVVRSLAWLVVLVGVIGVLFVAKLYELYAEHTARARAFRKELSRRIAGARVEAIRDEADERWRKEAPYLRKIPVHVLWLGPHIVILVGGSLLIAATYGR